MPITAVNLVLAVIILVLGLWAYTKNKSQVGLLVGIGFGLFGLSHLLTLLGLAAGMTAFLIIVRTIGYLLVIVALWGVVRGK